jgi:hypothetical protein
MLRSQGGITASHGVTPTQSQESAEQKIFWSKEEPVINAAQQKRVDELCGMIATEKDHKKVSEFARELSELLDVVSQGQKPVTNEPPLPTSP